MRNDKMTNAATKSHAKVNEVNLESSVGKNPETQRPALQMRGMATKGIYSVARNLDSNFRC
jgi:hypothetical protein